MWNKRAINGIDMGLENETKRERNMEIVNAFQVFLLLFFLWF